MHIMVTTGQSFGYLAIFKNSSTTQVILCLGLNVLINFNNILICFKFTMEDRQTKNTSIVWLVNL